MGFFWLVGAYLLRFIALKASVFVELGIARIANTFTIGYLFVVRFAWMGRTEITNSGRASLDNHQVLVTMDFFLATVV